MTPSHATAGVMSVGLNGKNQVSGLGDRVGDQHLLAESDDESPHPLGKEYPMNDAARAGRRS